MSTLRFAAALLLLATSCAPAWSYAGTTAAPSAQQNTVAAEPANAQSADKPRLTVGVSDPNTQLILPWFLTDIINAVNSHPSR
jgi:hypothetical protein